MILIEQESNQLRELIRLLERKLCVLEDGEMACCGISMAQCHALVEIGRMGSISLIDLATMLNLDNSTMSRTVNNLVNNGMVERRGIGLAIAMAIAKASGGEILVESAVGSGSVFTLSLPHHPRSA